MSDLNPRISVHFEQKLPTIRKFEMVSFSCSYSRDLAFGEGADEVIEKSFAFCKYKVRQQIEADPLVLKTEEPQ